MARGLVGSWQFNERAGTNLIDRSGRGNNATLAGSTLPAWGGSPYGAALAFVAAQAQYAQIADTNALSFTAGGAVDKPFSFHALVKWVSGNGNIISKYVGAYEYDLTIFADGSVACYVYSSVAQYMGRLTPAGTLTANTWYSIVATYDATKVVGGIKVYVNAVQRDSSSSEVNYVGMTNTAAPVRFGSINIAGYWLNGNIAAINIYNRALSQNEISMLHHDPFSMFRSQSVEYAGLTHGHRLTTIGHGLGSFSKFRRRSKWKGL